jgi:hypothetical protein
MALSRISEISCFCLIPVENYCIIGIIFVRITHGKCKFDSRREEGRSSDPGF